MYKCQAGYKLCMKTEKNILCHCCYTRGPTGDSWNTGNSVGKTCFSSDL